MRKFRIKVSTKKNGDKIYNVQSKKNLFYSWHTEVIYERCDGVNSIDSAREALLRIRKRYKDMENQKIVSVDYWTQKTYID
jgi:hypothetical protein